jgi:Domain of unknown function (DUF397)
MNEPRWRKSSYSGGQGNCVEVAGIVGRVVVRDTKDAATAVLRFSPDAWRKLVTRVKASLGSTLGPGALLRRVRGVACRRVSSLGRTTYASGVMFFAVLAWAAIVVGTLSAAGRLATLTIGRPRSSPKNLLLSLVAVAVGVSTLADQSGNAAFESLASRYLVILGHPAA